MLFVFFIQLNPLILYAQNAQTNDNQITSITWENNSLTVSTTGRISFTEARLKDPDRLVVDILNCSLQNKGLEKKFKSQSDETISISEPTAGQVRIIFLGTPSINRKSYLTNNERTLIIRIARISTEAYEEKIVENEKQTSLEKYTPGKFKDIYVKEEGDETSLTFFSTMSIKYNSYLLKNPDRFAIDLLNVLPPDYALPKFNPTTHVNAIRIGRAASGIEATRIVVDLAKENIDCDVHSNLLGNKLEITFKINKNKEEITKKAGIKVVIDPGHGGYDTGASYGGFEEKDINIVISEKLKKSLENYGITVFLTRDEDSFLSLAERIEIINSIKPNVVISIHGNALVTSHAIRGVETYYWTAQSQRLAYYVQRSILTHLKIPDHFIRKARFYVLRHTSSPAVLAELGFLSNHEDRQLLTSLSTQDEYAKALSEAILRFLDIDTQGKKGKDGKS